MFSFNNLIFEDEPVDILRKAINGLGIETEELASKCGLKRNELEKVLQGKTDLKNLETVAKFLGLRTEQLKKMITGQLEVPNLPHLKNFWIFTSDFGGMKVNSYLAVDQERRKGIAFDTGADATSLLETLIDENIHLEYLLLTHGHGDHIYEMDRIIEKTGCIAYAPRGEMIKGTRPIEPNQKLTLSGLEVRVHSVPGHSAAHVAYEISGLEAPVLIVGDALFAASMGKANISYLLSLESLHYLLSFSDNTFLAPGHGPMTTVALEKKINPFYNPSWLEYLRNKQR
ncbi:MAG: MBL fold metallo-hydrolase [Chthoniobacterales bacterium]|nr:MBL fold metallo-hydrolase [Chthoniobacterales bacterium]